MLRCCLATAFATAMLTATISLAQPELSAPPELGAQGMDWVKLTSGEWLAGEIKGLRDDEIQFESDKLDLLTLDWADVAALQSTAVRTYRFDQLGVFTGTAAMQEGQIAIRTADGQVQSFPRESLLLIIEGEGSEWDYWSASASLGWVMRSGNSDQLDFNARTHVRRQTPTLRSDLNYTGNFGEVEEVRNVDNHNLTVNMDRLITKGFFVTLGMVNWVRDPFQNIDSRTTIGAGLGYDIYRLPSFEWGIGVNAGYQVTQYVSVQATEDDSDDTFALIPSTRMAWDVSSDVELTASYTAQVALPESQNAFHHAETTLSVDVWGDILDVNLALIFDRVETPRTNEEGITPERNDFRTSFGLGVSL
jgi:putative salt-induced outer membrane protein YdiY